MCIRDRMAANLPASLKQIIANKGLKFYNVDAIRLAQEIGLGARINMIMMAAFFQVTKIIPPEEAVEYMKEAIIKSYGRKGEKIVQMNNRCV